MDKVYEKNYTTDDDDKDFYNFTLVHLKLYFFTISFSFVTKFILLTLLFRDNNYILNNIIFSKTWL